MSSSAENDNDKISFTSGDYEIAAGRASPVSAMEDETWDSRPKRHGFRSSKNTELSRSLDERHVNMIAFSTTVGIGCFLQSGKIISIIGPGGAVMAYIIMGCLVWSANAGLGEMTAVFPVKGPIIDFCGRFIDESVGFAIGWMAWFAYCILLATEVSVLAQLFNFYFDPEYLQSNGYPETTLQWQFGRDTSPEVWIALSLVLILIINILPVRVYGEVEYVFGSIKLIMMVLMIMFNVVINCVAKNKGEHNRFWTYQSPYGFFTNSYSLKISAKQSYQFFGDEGRLFAMWTAMNTIFFSVQGMFSVSITAAENRRLETDETIKLASRKIALRVILLYSLLVFTVGLNVPADDSMIIDSSIVSIRAGTHSPFIISCIRNGVTILPHILNAFFIFSAFSCGVNGLYTASRLLHALASLRNVWPAWAHWIRIRLERTTSKGVPLAAIVVSWFFGFLGFLGSDPSPAKILGRLAVLSSASMMLVYAAFSAAFLYFKTCCTVEAEPMDPVLLESDRGPILNRGANTYPYRSHLQWARAAFAMVGCLLFLIFNGWKSLLSPFSVPDFLAAYIVIPIFIVLVCAYHVKDERTWNPFSWTRRATMHVLNPLETRQTNPLRRRGRLHRKDPATIVSWDNAKGILEFIWTWLK